MIGILNNTFVEALGALTISFVYATGRFSKFCYRSWKTLFSNSWNYRLIMDQAMAVGVKSLPVALITALFVGMVMVLQTGVQLIQFGAKNYVPAIAFIANARELIPVFVAFVVGARVAASFTAEIGTMRVTEQIDAMEILHVDPYHYLIAPRIIAMTLMLPLICTLSLIASFYGGMLIGTTLLNINSLEYMTTTQKFALLTDPYSGLVKTIFFGNIIGLVGCYYGYYTSGGAEGVGRATTTSVVVTLMLILLMDFLLSRWTLFFIPLD
ncbi:MAG: ABC transporter permease [Candidatus Sumerlaeia bacterium]|nr:ABC transporter permease [Candidatus Sumerlaeia bacterium]